MEIEEEEKPISIYLYTHEEEAPESQNHNMIAINHPKVMRLGVGSLEQGVNLVAIGRTLFNRCQQENDDRNQTNKYRRVRLNGHFISSNVDGVSTMTWRNLISFFTSKGCANGLHHTNPIHVVHGPTAATVMSGSACNRYGNCIEKRKRMNGSLEQDVRESKKKPIYAKKRKSASIVEEEDDGGNEKKLKRWMVCKNEDGDIGEGKEAASVIDHSILSMKRKLKLDDDVDDEEHGQHMNKRFITSHPRASASCLEGIRLFALPTAASAGH